MGKAWKSACRSLGMEPGPRWTAMVGNTFHVQPYIWEFKPPRRRELDFLSSGACLKKDKATSIYSRPLKRISGTGDKYSVRRIWRKHFEMESRVVIIDSHPRSHASLNRTELKERKQPSWPGKAGIGLEDRTPCLLISWSLHKGTKRDP